MPGPKKVYTDHFNKCPATAEQLLNMQTIALVTGKAPATLQREAWDFYCASETIAALLKQHAESARCEQARSGKTLTQPEPD